MQKFFVEGTPIAQPRHGPGGAKRVFLDPKHPVRGWKDIVGWVVKAKRPKIYKGPLKLTCLFKIPTKKAERWGQYHAFPLDLNNLIKAVEDALKGITWVDDCQVALDGGSQKVWAAPEDAGVMIIIEEI